MSLTDVDVLDNIAEDDGAGLFSEGETSLTVTRTTFADNETNNEGGGAWTGGNRLTTFTDSVFSRNKAGVPEIDPLTNAPVLTPNTAGGGGLFTEGGPVTIKSSTFTDNSATEEGGGISIDNFGTFLLSDSLIKNNTSGADGGGIENSGMRVIFDRITVQDNRSTLDGGGIYNSSSGDFTIQDSTIQRNSAQDGGGIGNLPDADLFVKRSLILGNVARNPGLTEDGDPEEGGKGGGFFSMADGDAKIENTTISGNKAAVGGGGLFHDADGEVRLESDTIWRNSAPIGGGVGVVESDFVPEIPPQPNRAVIARNTIIGGSLDGGSCDWYIDSEGGNLDGGGLRKEPDIPLEIMLPMNTACFLNQPPTSNDTIKLGRDRRGNAKLDAIADNGGPTLTHRVLRDSLAVDQGIAPCPETDQRGIARPQNGKCDVGAFEYVGPPPDVDNEAPESEYLSGPIQDTLETMAFRFTGSDNMTAVEDLQFECRLIEFDLTEAPEPIAPWDPVPIEQQWVPCASPWSVPLMEEGFFTFELRAIDRAGNVEEEPTIHHFSGADEAPPNTVLVETPSAVSPNRSATFTFTAIDNQTPAQFMEYECRLDSRDPDMWLECFNPAIYGNLTSGTHTFEVRALDVAENMDPTPARFTWTVGSPSNSDAANVSLTAVADAMVDQVNPADNFLFLQELEVRSDATGDPLAVPPEPVVGQNGAHARAVRIAHRRVAVPAREGDAQALLDLRRDRPDARGDPACRLLEGEHRHVGQPAGHGRRGLTCLLSRAGLRRVGRHGSGPPDADSARRRPSRTPEPRLPDSRRERERLRDPRLPGVREPRAAAGSARADAAGPRAHLRQGPGACAAAPGRADRPHRGRVRPDAHRRARSSRTTSSTVRARVSSPAPPTS